ncbi:hypothetical protein FRD01_15190 [Microvenator marinus]|uniref:Uncharacterized protein n=1 Tax=Microvenator marinus TaxID=2600177 RepID=A0A5B8XRH1_9DELT|nr:hypothetical protein [Microvenator marinus]QED28552.1 hypothetical protein FRD01_15190 [Microvenator marinus]
MRTISFVLFIIFLSINFVTGCGDDGEPDSDKDTMANHHTYNGQCARMIAGELVFWPYNGYDCMSEEAWADGLEAACEQKCPGQQCDQPLTCESGARSFCDVESGKYACLGFGTKNPDTPFVCVDVKCEDRANQ